MLAPVTHILPVTNIRRERVLKVPSKVMVRKGQKVAATDVVAEANLHPQHLLLDVGRALGLSPEEADKQIQCSQGDKLEQGDIVAGPVGIFRRLIRTPREGQVLLSGSGQVLIELSTQPFQLKAGFSGEITDLVLDRGAIIETTGALVQAVWGNGRTDFGLMSVLAKSPDHILTHDQLDVSFRGSVVLAGHCQSAEALTTAAELPLRGLILSSLPAELVSTAVQLQLPVIVIEGFGQHSLDSVAYKLLSTNDRREVSVNAEQWDRYEGTRPEIIIPLPSTAGMSLQKETLIFSDGQQVRVVRAPYFGKIGTLLTMVGSVVLPNGVKAQAALVQLEDGKKVEIPLSNLEVFA